MSGGNMSNEERVRLLEGYSYCPSWRESGRVHGKHPKCKYCRFLEVINGR